jgi:hypothetical protein
VPRSVVSAPVAGTTTVALSVTGAMLWHYSTPARDLVPKGTEDPGNASQFYGEYQQLEGFALIVPQPDWWPASLVLAMGALGTVALVVFVGTRLVPGIRAQGRQQLHLIAAVYGIAGLVYGVGLAVVGISHPPFRSPPYIVSAGSSESDELIVISNNVSLGPILLTYPLLCLLVAYVVGLLSTLFQRR